MTHIILDPTAEPVSDAHALEYAAEHLTGEVRVANSTVLDAYRVLYMRGELDELTVTFQDGTTTEINHYGKLDRWVPDSITDMFINLSREIITTACNIRKEEKKTNG